MSTPLQPLKILLVGDGQDVRLTSAFELLGWQWSPCGLESWLVSGGPQGSWDAAIVDMTVERTPEVWLRIHHRVPQVPHALVLVVDGPVPSSFHYPRAGGLRVALLGAGSHADVIRSTVNLVRHVYQSVRPGADLDEVTPDPETLLDLERRSVVLEAVRQVQLDLEAVQSLLEPFESLGSRPSRPLGSREQEVLVWLMKGLAPGAIAARLGIAESTIKKHIHSIYRKRGVTSRAQLMAEH